MTCTCHHDSGHNDRILERLHLLLNRTETLMADVAALTAAVVAVDASVDALALRIPAPVPAADLQPAIDQLAAVKAKIDALPATPAV